MKQWEILHECDTEEGKPTCWFREINHRKYGKVCWISETENGYNVEVNRGEITAIITCKTLTSAKRWVSTNL